MNETKRAPSGEIWLIRLMLAAALMFGSEVLLWSDVLGRAWWEWPILIAGYLLIAALLLDLMARYRVRDFLGMMTIAGVYGLLNGLLLNPELTLFDIPRTLVSRVTGAHTLIGLEMLYLFLALTGGHLRHLRLVMVVGAVAVGAAWGFWVRWSPIYTEVPYGVIPLETMLIAGVVGTVIVAVITQIAYRRVRTARPADMMMSLPVLALVLMALIALLLLRVVQGSVDYTSLTLVAILLFLSMAILWFRRNTRLRIVLDYHLPLFPQRWIWTLLVIGVMFWTALLAYSLPLIGSDQFNVLTFIVFGFLLYGVAWLPTVSVLLGFRAYIRQVQATPPDE